MDTVRRGIIERFDKTRTDHHRYIRAHILKNHDMEEGKLQQYIVSFHRAKDHIDIVLISVLRHINWSSTTVNKESQVIILFGGLFQNTLPLATHFLSSSLHH